MNRYELEKEAAVRIPGGWHLHCDRSLQEESMISLLEKFIVSRDVPEGWVRMESSDKTDAWKFQLNDRKYFLKKYLERGSFDNLKAVFNGTRARKAWVNGNMLIEHGFLTPKVFVLGEKRSLFFPSENLLVTEFLDGASVLFLFLLNQFSLPLSFSELKRKRAFIRALGGYIGRLHQKGIFHGDLRSGNILVMYHDKTPCFYFIDNERNRHFPQGIPDRLRMKNLVQINMIVFPQVTFADRLRFFKAYLGENPHLEPLSKDWIRRVFLRTRERLRKIFPGVWGATSCIAFAAGTAFFGHVL